MEEKKAGDKNKKPASHGKKQVKERKLEKELLWILVFMGVLVVIFLVTSAYFKSLHSFEYKGLTFNEERIGTIPIFHHSYFFKAGDGGLINYNLYLRNDPRLIERIPVEGDKIAFNQGEVVFVSVDAPGLQECRYGPLAIASISSFLKDNQMSVLGGNLDFWDAGNKRQDWITCENTRGNKVIEIRKGNETRIDVNGKCHVIQVNECEILESVERFEVQTIVDAQKVKI